MTSHRFTAQANLDIEAIGTYIFDLNPVAADHFLTKLDQACEMLTSHPELGRARSKLGKGLRSFPIGNFLVFYTSTSEGIVIIRVLHGGRDLPALFSRP
jgi:toxin ParE1/3/4